MCFLFLAKSICTFTHTCVYIGTQSTVTLLCVCAIYVYTHRAHVCLMHIYEFRLRFKNVGEVSLSVTVYLPVS